MAVGLLDEPARQRIVAVIERTGLPVSGLRLDTDALLDAMAFDKKVSGGRVRFVLPDRIGHVVVRDDPKWTDEMRSELAEELSLDFDGVNVEFLTVESEDHLSIKVIERGVGWTRACGTGTCAVVAVAHRDEMCGTDVTVDNPGGALHVTLNGAAATLSGPVQFVANVEWLEA